MGSLNQALEGQDSWPQEWAEQSGAERPHLLIMILNTKEPRDWCILSQRGIPMNSGYQARLLSPAPSPEGQRLTTTKQPIKILFRHASKEETWKQPIRILFRHTSKEETWKQPVRILFRHAPKEEM